MVAPPVLPNPPAPPTTPGWAQYLLAFLLAILLAVVTTNTGFSRDAWSFGAGVFISLAAGVARSQIEKTTWTRAFLGILAGCMVVYSGLEILKWLNLPPSRATAVIVYPTERDRVPMAIELTRGSHNNFDCASNLWVVVKTAEPKFYFSPANCRGDSTWDSTRVRVGRKDIDAGCSFSMYVAVSSASLDSKLQAYSDKGEGSLEWPAGLTNIGKRTTVTREGIHCSGFEPPKPAAK